MTAEKRKGKESEIFCEVKESFTENLCPIEDREGDALLGYGISAIYPHKQVQGASFLHQ